MNAEGRRGIPLPSVVSFHPSSETPRSARGDIRVEEPSLLPHNGGRPGSTKSRRSTPSEFGGTFRSEVQIRSVQGLPSSSAPVDQRCDKVIRVQIEGTLELESTVLGDLAQFLCCDSHLLGRTRLCSLFLPLHDEAPATGLQHLFGRGQESDPVFWVMKGIRWLHKVTLMVHHLVRKLFVN